MTIDYKASFHRDIKKLKDKEQAAKLKEIISEIKAAKNLSEIKNIRRIEGYPNHYRIKTGNYRVGVVLSGDKVILVRFLNRKEIYRYFPER
ncbi:MAG: type II toxin-antitoxin system RelE/ParE family toxin [Nitrospirae bacterium]|nr:type II toxin-antitoxin system RelE/ParE family toxin [Nitrospirota bacterium]